MAARLVELNVVAEELVLQHGAHILCGGALVGVLEFLARDVGLCVAEVDGGGDHIDTGCSFAAANGIGDLLAALGGKFTGHISHGALVLEKPVGRILHKVAVDEFGRVGGAFLQTAQLGKILHEVALVRRDLQAGDQRLISSFVVLGENLRRAEQSGHSGVSRIGFEVFLGRVDGFRGLTGHHARDGAAAPHGRRVGIQFVDFGEQRFGIGAGVGVEGGIGALIENQGAQLAVGAALAEVEEKQDDHAGECSGGEDNRETVHGKKVEMTGKLNNPGGSNGKRIFQGGMDLAAALGQTDTVAREQTPRRIPDWAWGVFACLVTLIVFLPALRFPFFPFWDDDIHVHANPYIANLSWAGIGAFWSGPWQQLYIPLTYSAWAGLAAISRWWDGQPINTGALNAAWFHGANIAMHAVSTLLAYVLLRRTTEKFAPGAGATRVSMAAALGAAFFALHPLQVEPVAWISGLRDVLGGCLGLASLVVLSGGDKPKFARWFCATLLFAAALAAKPGAVTLPVVAALLAAGPFGWKPARLIRELGPWLVIGALWVLVTSNAQWAAELAKNLVPAWMRPLVAGDAFAFYVAKVIWPAGLSADYGRAPDAARAAGWLWWTWTGPVALAAVIASVKKLRIYLVPLGIFAAALLPTLGLVPFNFQLVSTVADRYAYFALIGPALALAMIVARSSRAWVAIAAAALVAVMITLTVGRLPLWSEDLKLFAATLTVNPQSWKSMHNYASALDDRGRTAEGEKLMREVIARRPDSAEAYNDLGVMLWKLGRRIEAAQMTQRALEVRPTPGTAKNLATMQAQLGNRAGQVAALRKGLELDPSDIVPMQQLAWLLSTAPEQELRNGNEALALAQKVVSTGQVSPGAVMALVAAQAELGQFDQARETAVNLVQQLEAAGDPLAPMVKNTVLAAIEAGRPVRSAAP